MGLLDMLVSARDTIKIDRDELKRRTRGDFGDKASALGLRAADNIFGNFIDDYDSLGEMAATGVNDLATGLYSDPIGTLQAGGEYLQGLVNTASTPYNPDAPMAALELASMATGFGGLAGAKVPKNAIGSNSPFRGDNISADLADSIERAPLVTHHNTTDTGILEAYNDRGIPMPSIGVSNLKYPALDNFGEISLLLDPRKLDPKLNRGMSIWPSDAYTGRQPRFFFDLSDRKGTTRSFESDPDFGHMDNSFINHEDFDDLDFLFKSAQFGVRNKILDPKDFSSIHEYAREVQRKSGDDFQKIFDEDGAVAYGNIKKMLPPDGDPYFASDGRRKPDVNHSLEEVLARMQRAGANKAGAEGGSYNPALTRALLSEKFDSIEDIQANRDLIIPRGNEMNDVKGNWNRFVDDAMNEYKDRHTASDYRTAEKVLNAMAAGEDLSMFNLSPAATQTGRGLVDSLRKEAKGMPTEYFEAKPNYSIKLDEFGAAVVPKDVKPLVKDKLKRSGIPQVTYDPLIEGDRGRAMRDAGGDFTFANKSKAGGLLSAMTANERIEASTPKSWRDPKYNKPHNHPISDNAFDVPPDQMNVMTESAGLLSPFRQRRIEDFQNRVMTPAYGDRAIAGKRLLGYDDIEYKNPVRSQGGRDFMRERGTGLWASEEKIMERKSKKVNELLEAGEDPLLVYTAMGAQSGDFSTIMRDAVMNQFDPSKISKKGAEIFDARMKKLGINNWSGTKSGKVSEDLERMSGTDRWQVWQEMDKAAYRNEGFPDIGKTRVSMTDPALLDVDSFSSGLTVGRPTGLLSNTKFDRHPSYEYQIGGDYEGSIGNIAGPIMWRDWFEAKRQAGRPARFDQRAFMMNSPELTQRVDQQLVDEVNEYIIRQEQLR